MALIQDSSSFKRADSYVGDPSRVLILGLDVPADIDPALAELAAHQDNASNATELTDEFINSFVEVARINSANERSKTRVGNEQATRATYVKITSVDPRLDPFVLTHKNGDRFVIVALAGRRRVRGIRAANVLHRWTPDMPEYINVKLDVSRTPDMTIADATLLRLIENSMRSNLDPVAEGEEIVRLATLMAAELKTDGQPPSKKEIKRAVAQLAPYYGGRKGKASAASMQNKAALASLTDEIAAKVSDGSITASAGYEIAKLPPERQSEAVERATVGGKLDLNVLKAVVKSMRNAAGEEPILVAPKKSELIELANKLSSDYPVHGHMATLALQYAAGTTSIDELMIYIRNAALAAGDISNDDDTEVNDHDDNAQIDA